MTATRDIEPIRFYKGTETGIIVEKEDFDKSLFREQYKQAFALIDKIWGFQSSYKEQSGEKTHLGSNLISFCGDRGQGKTSCLTTMATILEEKDIFEKAKVLFEDGNRYSRLSGTFLVLDMIDPSFFDPKHNLIDLLLGQMYSHLISDSENNKRNYEELVGKCSKVLQDFAEVKRCLRTVNGHYDTDVYDELEETDNLSAAVNLRECLDHLFSDYLSYYNKEKLLICIDDLDLNMQCGYRMAEEIRNYLSLSNNCVLFVALKVEQMEDVVFSEFKKTVNGIADEELRDMAERYVTKLIPLSQRVLMPTGDIVLEQKIQLCDDESTPVEYATVKEAVVRMIYEKTRYIFVNSPMVSPIVPSNLRELRHLVGLLWDMKDEKSEGVEDEMGDSENKRVFKQYFFQEWTKCLDKKDRDFALDICKRPDPISINKSVLHHLTNRLQGLDTVSDLINENNQEYNISLGDVFKCMRVWEHTICTTDDKNFLFFLRAFYSIKMYDLYNVISSKEEPRSPNIVNNKADSKTPSLYKYDLILQEQNQLQRLLNGSYFSYNMGELIAPEGGVVSRDKRAISTTNLWAALKIVKDADYTKNENKAGDNIGEQGSSTGTNDSTGSSSYAENNSNTDTGTHTDNSDTDSPSQDSDDAENNSNTDDVSNTTDPSDSISDIKYLQLCEFFALTTVRPLTSRENVDSINRKLNTPYYLTPIKMSSNFLHFDVTSIFYNIVNIKQTYNKFSDVVTDFDLYQKATECKDSLLNKMLNVVGKVGDSDWDRMHRLISDAIIRMSEVQMSIMDSSEYNRKQDKDKDKGENSFKLRKFYERIQQIGIKLYPVTGDDCHELKFLFLSPIIKFLDDKNEELLNSVFVNSKSDTTITTPESLFQELIDAISAANIEFPQNAKSLKELFSGNDTIKTTYTMVSKTTWNKILGNVRINYEKLEDLIDKISHEKEVVINEIQKKL